MYLLQLGLLQSKVRIYIDESGVNDDEVCLSGWGRRGLRLLCKKKASHSARASIIAAYCNNKIIAQMVIEKAFTRQDVEYFLEHFLIPKINFPAVIIMDNASIHKNGNIEQIVNQNPLCQLLYLPPYSPDLNPIEHIWTAVKTYVRTFLTDNLLSVDDGVTKLFNAFIFSFEKLKIVQSI